MKKFTRRFLAAFFAAVLMVTTLMSLNIGTAFAATSGSCGTNATWSYDTSTKTLTISGTGATKNYYKTKSTAAPWNDYKSELVKVVVNEGITEIGYSNFYNCPLLTSVSLPSTLTKLKGTGAPKYTGSTEMLSYGCFESCPALESITLPANLTEIEPFVFYQCTALKRIIIPDSVTTIGNYAFFDCTGLTRLTMGANLATIGTMSFSKTKMKTIDWNDTITTIPLSAFMDSEIVTVELPENITTVERLAFKTCKFLTTITIHNPSTEFKDNFCEGSDQSITIRGHAGSTAQSFATQYGYAFESIDACAHENTHTVISKEPTCEEKGVQQTICDDCGAVVLETEIDALGHEWGEPVEEVDCTKEDGHIYKTYVCSRCNETKTDAVHQYTSGIDPTNIDTSAIDFDTTSLISLISRLRDFDWSTLSEEPIYVWVDGYYSKTTIREANCTQYGGEYYKCNVEGCNKRELRPLLPHHTVETWKVTKKATCTEDGTRTGTCTECGNTVTETIKATGHTYDAENPSEVWDSEEDGHTHKVFICSTCGEEVEEYVHNEWIDGYYTPTSTTYDNCELPGVELDRCNLCGTLRTQTVPARGEHDLYETGRTEPDCTTRGRINKACHNCQYTTVEYIPALGHDFVRDDSKSTDATCTEAGSIFYKCSRCSASKTDSVEALGHIAKEGTWVVDTAPTCTKDGAGHGVCDRCNEAYTGTIAALGHDYQPVETEITDEDKPGHVLSTPQCTRCNSREAGTIVHKEWTDGNYTVTTTTPATCVLGAREVRQCTICNTVGTVEVSPALGHMWRYTGTITNDAINARLSQEIEIPDVPGVNVSDYIGNAAVLAFINSLPIEAEQTDDGFTFSGKVTKDGVTFLCPHCFRTTTKPIAEVKALWNFDVVGTAPHRTGLITVDEGEETEHTEEVDLTSYLDFNGDGIINGRDYGYLKTLTAKEAEAVAAAEAEQEQTEEVNHE
ncbi:MAG: leucine-rich repeat domain-containing protein [Ruminococcaceae bacterium]|nr:leucine-rich repeat domain-containing protein [Oscillospiraceae bacterium]